MVNCGWHLNRAASTSECDQKCCGCAEANPSAGKHCFTYVLLSFASNLACPLHCNPFQLTQGNAFQTALTADRSPDSHQREPNQNHSPGSRYISHKVPSGPTNTSIKTEKKKKKTFHIKLLFSRLNQLGWYENGGEYGFRFFASFFYCFVFFVC